MDMDVARQESNPIQRYCGPRGAVRRQQRFGVVLLAVFSSSSGVAVEPTAERPWTPRDSVAVRYFGSGAWGQAIDNRVSASPDGRYFFLMNRRGDLTSDCNLETLEVFNIAAIRKELRSPHGDRRGIVKPIASVTRDGCWSDRSALGSVDWTQDSRSITFMGRDSRGTDQVYELSIATDRVRALTKDLYGVRRFERVGDSIVYWRQIELEGERTKSSYPAFPVQRDVVREMLPIKTEILASHGGSWPWVLVRSPFSGDGPWIAPNGRAAILIEVETNVPVHWEGYLGNRQRTILDPDLPMRDNTYPRFAIADLVRQDVRSIVDAPAGVILRRRDDLSGQDSSVGSMIRYSAFWSTDSSRAILVNTALPLTGDPERRSMGYIVDYEVSTGRIHILEPLAANLKSERSDLVRRVGAVGWLKSGVSLLVTHTVDGGQKALGTVYTFNGRGWTARPVGPAVKLPAPPALGTSLEGGIKVAIRQGANEPPTLIAAQDNEELSLSSPDSALNGVWRAKLEPFEWQGPQGTTETGGLMLPRLSADAPPPPLVIQAFHYRRNFFLPDGAYPTAYAAQPLVARGIAVLQIDILDLGVDTVNERHRFVERIDACVEALAKRRLADPGRVGLIGFSRGGMNTYYAVTHPGSTHLAAAISADAWTGSFSTYTPAAAGRAWSDGESSYDPYVAINGKHFWQAKQLWLEEDPIFNVDKVRTPVMFSEHALAVDGQKVPSASAAATLGAFRLNSKPVEYLYFPQGDHWLLRPRERLASLEATVDWMSFWLQDHEDPSPEKAEQYVRWRAMRESNGAAD